MRITIKIVMTILIVASAAAVDAFGQGARIRIGILDLENLGKDEADAKRATELLIRLMGKSGVAEVYSQERIAEEFQRVDRRIPVNCGDPRCVMDVGGMINLDRMISGTVDVGKKSCGVHLYLYDIFERQKIGEASIAGQPGEPLDSLLANAVAVLHGREGGKTTRRYYGPEVHNEKQMIISSGAVIGAGLIWGLVNYAKLSGTATLTAQDRDLSLSGISASATQIAMFARPAALANAYVGASDDAYGVLYNPAGMAWVRGPEAIVGYQYRFGMVNNIAASFVNKATRDIGFGQALLYSGDPDNLMTEMYFVSAAAYRLNKLLFLPHPVSVGMSVKFISQSVNGEVDPAEVLTRYNVSGGSFGAGLDFGLLAELAEEIRYGLLLRDIPILTRWSNTTTGESYNESAPMTLHMGGTYQAGYTTFLIAEGQIPIAAEQKWKMSGGIEQEIFRVMYLRVGIQKQIQSILPTPWKFTGGFGIKAATVSLDGSYEYNTLFYAGSMADPVEYPVANVSFKVGF